MPSLPAALPTCLLTPACCSGLPAAADIKAGWGISFDPADFALFKATRPCPADTYGVANETYGLISALQGVHQEPARTSRVHLLHRLQEPRRVWIHLRGSQPGAS
jgi:hypothetical protein